MDESDKKCIEFYEYVKIISIKVNRIGSVTDPRSPLLARGLEQYSRLRIRVTKQIRNYLINDNLSINLTKIL